MLNSYNHQNQSLSEDGLEEIILQLIALNGGSGAAFVDKPSSEFTRPNNTTAYDSGDEIGSDPDAVVPPLSWTISTVNDQKVILTGVQAIFDKKTAAVPEIDLYLFSSDIACAGDNDQYDPSATDVLKLIGIVGLDDFAVTGNRMVCDGLMNASETVLTPKTGTATVYGIPVLRSAWTPSASMKLKVLLNIKKA